MFITFKVNNVNLILFQIDKLVILDYLSLSIVLFTD